MLEKGVVRSKYDLSLGFIKRMIQWHFNYYFFGKGTPVSAGLYITDSCNYFCKMCDIRMQEDPAVIPLEIFQKHVDSLGRMGVLYFSVSGGEPTLVRDLVDRLDYAKKKIPYVHLVTNGSTMTRDLATRLGSTGLNEVSISVDGMEDFHNSVRGVGNAFTKAWNAIGLLQSHAPNIQIVVNSLLTHNNLESLRMLRKEMDAHYPNVLQKFLPITKHQLFLTQDRTSNIIPGVPASGADLKSFIHEAIDSPKTVNSSLFLKKAYLYLMGQEDVLSEFKRCLYPYHAIEFDYKGNPYPCITGTKHYQQEGSDWSGENLEKLIDSVAYRALQKDLEGCQECKGSMMLCYYEPRLSFPIHNLVGSIFRSYFSH